ncbi:MAG: branched-chain amino acid ABC transporter permease [Spirochaetaceae bacterium]|jgi:branched-chain amino acid transport system permease protein|nr:branched-chain amino acid ABC transporter permease [Spirochaetaceae bacterium]
MIVQAVINGILFGAVYAMIGIGFSLVWGVMGIVNLAHGSFIMAGAYISFTLFAAWGLDPFLSAPLVMVVLFGAAYGIQRLLINRIVRGPSFITLTFTFGLQILIANICLLIWKADLRSAKLSYSSASLFENGAVTIPLVRFGIFAAAIILTILFYLFMRKTRIGIAINATALNYEGARTVGVDVDNIYAITFAVSAALAGAAGALMLPITSMNPFFGGDIINKAFVVSVLGGLGSTAGALAGGMCLALAETLGTVFLPSSAQELIGFVFFIAVLVFRPQGLLGKRFY